MVALSGCGGGGGGASGGFFVPAPGGTAPAPQTLAAVPVEPIVPSATVAAQCAQPRLGAEPATGAAYADRPGSLATEKQWVRAWIDETYLWYGEVPTGLAAADFATPQAYFSVLKTPQLLPSGRAKDRFHFTEDTARYRARAGSGVEIGYGAELAFLSSAIPRDVRVAYTEPDSPAARAGLVRGSRLLAIDGIDLVAGTDTAALNAGLLPVREGETHLLRVRFPDGAEREVRLQAAAITRAPVQHVTTFATASGPVGYLLFNDQPASAEAALITAVTQLRDAGIVDLVVDLRYNGGGLLDVASEFATMVAPAAITQGAVFERLRFNDKNPFGFTAAQTIVPFHTLARGLSAPAGQPLPRLNLSRLTVLAGGDTCSASESIINGLRGVGMQVDLIGGATCGKPYGFLPQDNCGTTYFAIQFQGVNQRGFGDYGDGFAPTCAVPDDFAHALGDPAEARLAAALRWRATGTCPVADAGKAAGAGAAKGVKADPGEGGAAPLLVRPPWRENRWLARPG